MEVDKGNGKEISCEPVREETPSRADVPSEGLFVHPPHEKRRMREKRPLKPTNVSLIFGLPNTTKQSILEKRFLDYVRSFWLVRSERYCPVLVQCNGVDATLKDCYHVLMVKKCMSTGYVRMASKLYTRQWEVEQFPSKSNSLAILMSPNFSNRALSSTNKYQVALRHWNAIANIPLGELLVQRQGGTLIICT